jgi:spore maturation protein CgeB
VRISIFGSSLVSAYWNGAATYYRGIVRALAAHGHRITFYEPDAFERQKHRDIDDPPWAKVVVYAPTAEAAQAALDTASGDDVIIKASGVGVFDELLEEAVVSLKKDSNLIGFWDVDAPATLDRIRTRADDPFRPLIPQFDLILTYGGGIPVTSAYEEAGARFCVPIYNGLDPSTHHPVQPVMDFAGALGLLANRLPDRETRVEEFFLKPASMLPRMRFLLGGAGWRDKTMPRNIRYFDHVYTCDHNAFNSTPRAVLNVSRDSMARYGFSPATRVFESAGAAACLITDAWEGIDTFFEPDTEILVARDGAEVAAHLASLTPARSEAIGRAAHRRALAHHTYAHRAEQLETILAGQFAVGASAL